MNEKKYIKIIIAEIVLLAAIFFISLNFNLPKMERTQAKDSLIRDLAFDRVRIENAANILLSLQDFITDKGTIPANLQDLKDAGYADSWENFNDPKTGQPYYFENTGRNFIFCVNN